MASWEPSGHVVLEVMFFIGCFTQGYPLVLFNPSMIELPIKPRSALLPSDTVGSRLMKTRQANYPKLQCTVGLGAGPIYQSWNLRASRNVLVIGGQET